MAFAFGISHLVRAFFYSTVNIRIAPHRDPIHITSDIDVLCGFMLFMILDMSLLDVVRAKPRPGGIRKGRRRRINFLSEFYLTQHTGGVPAWRPASVHCGLLAVVLCSSGVGLNNGLTWLLAAGLLGAKSWGRLKLFKHELLRPSSQGERSASLPLESIV